MISNEWYSGYIQWHSPLLTTEWSVWGYLFWVRSFANGCESKMPCKIGFEICYWPETTESNCNSARRKQVGPKVFASALSHSNFVLPGHYMLVVLSPNNI
jgi:hypothetical protein